MRLKHRNSQKRIIFKDAVYFTTIKTYNNFPFFQEKIFCNLFIENLRLCKELKQFQLHGWVLIYDHFHLLIQPNDEFNVSKVIQFLKRNISRNINFIMGYNKCDELSGNTKFTKTSEGDNDHCRLRVRGELMMTHKFIFKKLIFKFRFQIKYFNQNPYPIFKWQKSFHDHYIRNKNDFDHHMEYIFNNLHKHHLSKNWPYIFTNEKYNNLLNEI